MIVSKFGNSDNFANLSKSAQKIINYVSSLDLNTLELGKHSVEGFSTEEAFFMILEYQTDATSQVGPEFHKVYTDVQFLLKGKEKCGWAIMTDEQIASFTEKYSYSEEKDICFTKEEDMELNYFSMLLGEFYIFTPNTLHMPNLNAIETSDVRKVVIKIKTDILG